MQIHSAAKPPSRSSATASAVPFPLETITKETAENLNRRTESLLNQIKELQKAGALNLNVLDNLEDLIKSTKESQNLLVSVKKSQNLLVKRPRDESNKRSTEPAAKIHKISSEQQTATWGSKELGRRSSSTPSSSPERS